MKLFNKPSWLKPEINELAYWFHLAILAFVVLALLELFVGGGMLSVWNVLLSVPLLAAGDVTAHSILKLD